jgi:alcohol dehydrogenase (cytochrome c)
MNSRLLYRIASSLVVSIGFFVTPPAHANDWMSFNRTLDGQRFVPLRQINRGNVAQLATVCEADMGILGTFHTGPLLVRDHLYVTTGYATVDFDPTNCQVRWKHLFQFDGPIISNVNRGVAYLQGRLFRSSPHGVLFALDAKSGKELWRSKIADPAVGEYLPSAPIAWRGKVFIGIAGSDFGVKGRVLAFDAKTGRELWRFNTIPKEGDPGFETWKQPRPAHFGGAGTWASYTLDPKRGELFVPLGNPAPMYSPDARPGDNLYTNSFVVLDA